MALAVVWEQPQGRPFVRAKLLDVVVVFIGVALVLAAFVANLTLQLVTTYGVELADRLGLERVDARILGSVGQTLATLGITMAALLILYRLAPNAPSLRALLPGVLVGGVAVQLAIIGFSIYIGFVAGFEAIYGALGSIFGFLFLVYLVASCVIIGAEVVAAWAEAARPRDDDGPPRTLIEQVKDAVLGLVRAPRDPLPETSPKRGTGDS